MKAFYSMYLFIYFVLIYVDQKYHSSISFSIKKKMYQNGKSFKIVLQPEYRVMSNSLIELLGMREPSADDNLL